MQRIAIIGGGIAGLSAAFYLEQARRAGKPIEWTLYEASPRLGGVIKTEHREGFTLESGPDSFLTMKPAAAELAQELGIGDQLIHSNDARRKTYILVNGKLVPMPDGLQMMVPTNAWATAVSPLFSLRTKFAMLGEYVSPPAPLAADEDESVASFVERHFGSEVVERLAAPLLAGVYGGDASALSARSVLPNFVAMEAKHRSLVRGVLRSRRESSGAAKPLFTSFKGGMEQLTDAIVRELPPAQIFCGDAVLALERDGNQWRVISTDGRHNTYSAIVIALPAYLAGALLRPFDAALADELGEIPYASSTVVSLAYDSAITLRPGFGFLVPRSESKLMMACTFAHQKFDGRAPQGASLLRLFISGSPDQSDDDLVSILRAEVAAILGIHAEPAFANVSRWNRAMAQYTVGHAQRIEHIQRKVEALPSIYVIGNAYAGIGVPDCIRAGKNTAAKLIS